MKPIFLNARFKKAPITGVQRYAWEISNRIPDLFSLEPKFFFSGLKGHLWEQLELNRASRNGILWSPCNTGPMAHNKQVITIHDLAVFDSPETFSKAFGKWYRCLLPLLAKRSLEILTVSQFSAQRIVDLLKVKETKVSIVHNGISSAFTRQTDEAVAAAKKNFDIVGDYVVCLASLDPRKNVSLLVKLAVKLENRIPLKFVFIGGRRPHVFGDLVIPEAKNIQWLGYVEDKWLPSLYSGAKALVLPSKYEGFGIPIIEALACGVRCIVSDIPPFREIGAPGIRYCRTDDLDDWEAALLDTGDSVSSPNETSFDIEDRYSWDHSARTVSAILNRFR